eukprot:TRINITY_DN100993_c0_g1_i1.p1 TRINITY_DN100993_c0_g1~~TRINITY_DN100993_c0_g1_i1.p1  ORF type:complete len:735 (-),score=149.09 TRINITY_DN100993_c0_g1_i1:92-2296(-)
MRSDALAPAAAGDEQAPARPLQTQWLTDESWQSLFDVIATALDEQQDARAALAKLRAEHGRLRQLLPEKRNRSQVSEADDASTEASSAPLKKPSLLERRCPTVRPPVLQLAKPDVSGGAPTSTTQGPPQPAKKPLLQFTRRTLSNQPADKVSEEQASAEAAEKPTQERRASGLRPPLLQIQKPDALTPVSLERHDVQQGGTGGAETPQGKRSLLERRGSSLTPPALAIEKVKTTDIDSGSPLAVKYTVFDVLGSGSTSIVRRGVRKSDGVQVALKTMRSRDCEMIDAAQKEFNLMKCLDHPHVIKAFEFHIWGGQAVTVMECFPGNTLDIALKSFEGCRMPEEPTARQLSSQLVHVLAYMHSREMLHRDIKPENTLVSPDSTVLKLIDFNTACTLENGLALTPAGTVFYMAPEVLQHDPCSKASDVFSAGLCIYQMLAGKLPQKRDQGQISREGLVEHGRRPIGLGGSRWKDASDSSKDFLAPCLEIDDAKRTASSALLQHPWVLPFSAFNRQESKALSQISTDTPCSTRSAWSSSAEMQRLEQRLADQDSQLKLLVTARDDLLASNANDSQVTALLRYTKELEAMFDEQVRSGARVAAAHQVGNDVVPKKNIESMVPVAKKRTVSSVASGSTGGSAYGDGASTACTEEDNLFLTGADSLKPSPKIQANLQTSGSPTKKTVSFHDRSLGSRREAGSQEGLEAGVSMSTTKTVKPYFQDAQVSVAGSGAGGGRFL